MKKTIFAFILTMLAWKCSSAEEDIEYKIYKEAATMVDNCRMDAISLCLKERAVEYIENLPDELDMSYGFRIRKSKENDTNTLENELKENASSEEVLDNVLMEKITGYIQSHTLEFSVPGNEFNESLEGVEGRKKKGGGGMRMRPLLYLLYMKAAIIGGLVMKFLGLIAFKALLLAKIALTISSVIALKKVAESGKHHSSTYEVYGHPYDANHRSFEARHENVDGI